MISAALGAALVAGVAVLFFHGVSLLNLWVERLVAKRKAKKAK